MNDPAANTRELLRLLDLERTDDSVPGTREADWFTGINQLKPDGRIFGGQVLSQCVVAAGRTVPGDRFIHSFHGYFLRAGDVNVPIKFGVENLRDGRSFSARRVHAYQHDKPIMSATMSFQIEDDGLEHAAEFPANIPEPEGLPDIADTVAAIPHLQAREWLQKRPFLFHPVSPSIMFQHAGPRTSLQAVWIKAGGHVPTDPSLNAAALAYVSDFNLLEPVLRRHGLAWTEPGLKMASLDHAMWWHRRVDVNDWMLYVQESPAAQNGRGLGLGRIFDREGRLLATVAQEGMVRVPTA